MIHVLVQTYSSLLQAGVLTSLYYDLFMLARSTLSLFATRNSLVHSLSLAKARKKYRTYYLCDNESGQYLLMNLALCKLLQCHVSIHYCLVFVRSVKEANVRACSQCLDWHSQRLPNSSFFRSTTRNAAPCASRSIRFRCPPVTDK